MSQEKTQILVVEDNEEVRENLEEILTLYGYQIETAADGIIGVRKAMTNPPDLILCDVMMPELDGFGVLNILNENERTATIPFIFITAKTEKEDIRRGMNLGADDYITKPFYKDELLTVIRTRLRKAQANKSARSGAPNSAAPDQERGLKSLIEAIQEQGRYQNFTKRDLIVREGENAHYLYLVDKGYVHLRRSHEYGKDYIIAELGPGDLFAYSSLIERQTFVYTAQVGLEDCGCYLLPVDKFYQLINHDQHIAAAIMHLLAGRLVDRDKKLVNQAYDSVRRRTALTLCDLIEKHGSMTITIQRDDLAQMVGSTKESIIRSLSDFKEGKLISIKGSKITIEAPEKLRNLAI
ncbi:MAG: response regulator [Bacteroidota bacterium]